MPTLLSISPPALSWRWAVARCFPKIYGGKKQIKRILAGGFLALTGSIWALAFVIIAGNNLTSEWTTPPGRLLTTMMDMNVLLLFIISVIVVIAGVFLMIQECFEKNK